MLKMVLLGGCLTQKDGDAYGMNRSSRLVSRYYWLLPLLLRSAQHRSVREKIYLDPLSLSGALNRRADSPCSSYRSSRMFKSKLLRNADNTEQVRWLFMCVCVDGSRIAVKWWNWLQVHGRQIVSCFLKLRKLNRVISSNAGEVRTVCRGDSCN